MQKEHLVKPSSVNLQMLAGTLWVSAGITQQLLTVTSTRLSLSLVVYIISLASNNLCIFLKCLMMEMRKHSEEHHCVLRVKGILQRVRYETVTYLMFLVSVSF